MQQSPHVVVIGAGTLGICTAVNLLERGAHVTVLEAHAIASGSSGRSVGVIGTQFTDPFQILLRTHAFRQFHAWERHGLRLNRIGYLRLARTEPQMQQLAKSVELQAAAGFRAQLYPASRLSELVPHMHTTGLAGGIFGPDNGFIDPYQLCLLLADLIRDAGGEIRQACRLDGVDRASGGYRLHTSKGVLDCDVVVNAAGAWAPRVAGMLGQTLHIRPERHEAVQVLLDRPLDYTMPMVMDLVDGEGTGLNFRHDKPAELIAEIHKVHAAAPEDPDSYNDQCDEASKADLAALLLERVPDLPGARLGRGWAGLYPVSGNGLPLVGPIDRSEPTLITAAGAGGYGIQLAPVIGQVAADWAVHGRPVSVPEAERLLPLGRVQ